MQNLLTQTGLFHKKTPLYCKLFSTIDISVLSKLRRVAFKLFYLGFFSIKKSHYFICQQGAQGKQNVKDNSANLTCLLEESFIQHYSSLRC